MISIMSITVSKFVYTVIAHDIAKKINTSFICRLTLYFGNGFKSIYLCILMKLKTFEADDANMEMPP